MKFIACAYAVLMSFLTVIWKALTTAVATAIFVILVGNFGFHTDRDEAFRAIDPENELCRQSQASPWSVLSQSNVGNDEMLAIAKGQLSQADFAAMADSLLHRRGSVALMLKRRKNPQTDWDTRLRCAIQQHTVKWNLRYSATSRPRLQSPRDAQPRYHLAFLEFKENGDPYSLTDADGVPYPPEKLAETKKVGQIEALARHLWKYTGNNFVIVFIHGWRHNADLGDGNVADLRVYAARVARHLTHRCEIEGRYCGAHVTAVYVGWRGARVNEEFLARNFGFLGEQFAQIAAIPTLFDRKSVSESVAPYVVSAVRAIDANVEKDKGDRVIVFGHSLGGNMLLTGLTETFVKQAERHAFATQGADAPIMKSPIGDLVILINPASEAEKWTQI